jgi:PPOX class probable F420-dependent enzyme
MDLSDKQVAFLQQARAATMVTLRADGTPHSVRVGVALVDGKVWSSGVPSRARTKHLRRDSRSTLTVFEAGYGYLTIESRVTILDGPDAPELSVRLFQVMQSGRQDPNILNWNGKPLGLDEFLQAMRDEQRLIYEFAPLRAYGLY